ncbi:MAG: PepSY-associated TM helix domain-containing protein [Myxococcota bacterium]
MSDRLPVRARLRLVHRWLGLGTAFFLIVAGLTGALIAWEHELDSRLAPGMYHAHWEGEPRSPLDLADALEHADPRVVVTYMPLGHEPDEALQLWVQPRTDPSTGAPYVLDYTTAAMDPGTGRVQERRQWGRLSVRPLDLMPMIYKLHYTLHLPWVSGVDAGALLMGIVALVWCFDSLVALIVAFPSRGAWRRSFAFRWQRGGPALLFDLHRSGGVWAWGLVLAMAVTAVSMNLGSQVVEPLVSLVSPIPENPFETRPHGEGTQEPRLDRAAIVERARELGQARGFGAPPGGLFYSPTQHLYAVGFFAPGDGHGDLSLGNPWVHFDADSGEVLMAEVPGEGSAGERFMQLQFPIHSGRIAGTAGRIAVSVLGLVIAGLATTGVWLWVRRRLR